MSSDRSARVSLHLLLLSTLLFGGCTSSKPDCPVYDVGLIEGALIGGGMPVSARVRALPVGNDRYTVLETWSDSTGSYSIAAPSGPYIVEVRTVSTGLYYGRTGARWDKSSADTIHVGRDITRGDFMTGRLAVEVQTSPPLSDYVGCELYEEYRGSYVRRGRDDDSPAEDGVFRFLFPTIPEGGYRLRLMTKDSEIWLAGAFDPDHADAIRVSRGAPTEYAARLASWGHISGRVVGCWDGESRAELIAIDADSAVASDCQAQSDGTFAMNLLLARPVRIFARRDRIERWIGGPDFQRATVFDLHPGESLDDVALVESGIDCTFDSLMDGQTMIIMRLVNEAGVFNADGWYGLPLRIPNLQPGTYRLRIEPYRMSEWLPQWYDGSDSLSTAAPIVISQPGEIAHVAMHLIKGGTIRGRVLRAEGDPATGTEIRYDLLGQGNGYPRYGGSTDWQGRFAILGLEDGDYIIGSQRSDYTTWWFPGTTDRGAAETITIRDHGDVVGIEWRVP